MISKFAPRQRFDMYKVPRGLHEQYQKLHRATARAIRHAQSDEKVARSRRRISPSTLCHEERALRIWKTMFLLGLGRLLTEVCKTPRLPWNMSLRIRSNYCICHAKSWSYPKSIQTTVSQNETLAPLKSSSKFTHYPGLPRKNGRLTTSHSDPRLPAFSQRVRCPPSTTFQTTLAVYSYRKNSLVWTHFLFCIETHGFGDPPFEENPWLSRFARFSMESGVVSMRPQLYNL